jgi:Coenzyme PQQ synthesis protein D (PqqD)
MMISSDARFQIPKDIQFRQVAGESILLNLSAGTYFCLNEIGASMWQGLAEHGEIEPVVQALLEEYDVEEDRLRSDLLDLVEQLLEKDLLQRAASA